MPSSWLEGPPPEHYPQPSGHDGLQGGCERRKAVPAADIITPNQFELDYLTGQQSRTLAEALGAVKAAHALGPRAVLVTSLHTEDTPEDAIDMLASDDTGRFRLRTPRLNMIVNGAGDAVAALFFAHYLRSGKIGEALSRAGSAIFGVLAKTAELGAPEIQLVVAQDEIVNPSRVFSSARSCTRKSLRISLSVATSLV